MAGRLAITACLVFSGLTALVYQTIWVRLLGFSFGTTTEAISAVLAVFFGGLALGNALAAARLARVQRPLRVYALLELAIGLYALASLPLLRHLDALYAVVGADHSAAAMTALRVAAAAAVLLPPAIAMGATLPVVARGLVTDDATRGRWSAILYTANTLGAVAGAYLCGFWLIPGLGLGRAVLLAAGLNLAVAAGVLAVGGGLRASPQASGEAAAAAEPAHRVPRGFFLACFGVSGFVAIGYEIVWTKVFGIVMEGTLYGFAAVLSAFLLGIALGSLAIAPAVDRLRDLPRAFGVLHVAIALSVLLGMTLVPDLPFYFQQLADRGGDAIHLLYLLVLPIVLVPTALFGAAFPVLIRLYTVHAAGVGRGIGIATAVNTAGSIAASLMVGFWWIPAFGMDRSLDALLALDAGVALLVLGGFQRTRGWPARLVFAASLAALGLARAPFEGVQVDRAIAGRAVQARNLADYHRKLDAEIASQIFRAEGKSSIVTVYRHLQGRLLRTNGLPEAGYTYVPPYYPAESMFLGILPYLFAEGSSRGLLIGLGGGNTLESLAETELDRIDVVELEAKVVAALGPFAAHRDDPLDDPRVHLELNDGRNELLLARYAGRAPWDVIASQPSHPWRVGAANLFTEEYFRLARSMLAEGGGFALWVNGFRMDAESLLAIVASFERVFPGALLFDASHEIEREAFLLLGGHSPVVLDVDALARRMDEPRLRRHLDRFGIDSVERLLAHLEGPAAAFAALASHPSNTDDDAYVETRVPRRMHWSMVDFASVERRLPPDSPVLPPTEGAVDVARLAEQLLGLPNAAALAARIERLLRVHGDALHPAVRATLVARARALDRQETERATAALAEIARRYPTRPEPWRALASLPAADGLGGAAAAERAFERSGSAADAFAAGRAHFAAGDADAAFAWFARIPPAERSGFPALAWFDTWRALERDEGNEALRRAYDALVAFRATDAGSTTSGIDELLARAAFALGDLTAARGHADLSRNERRRRGSAALRQAGLALQRGRLDVAARAAAEAERWIPADADLLRLRVRLAVARGDPEAAEEALHALRRWSPNRANAILMENRLREEIGLPLLPPESIEALWRESHPLAAAPGSEMAPSPDPGT